MVKGKVCNDKSRQTQIERLFASLLLFYAMRVILSPGKGTQLWRGKFNVTQTPSDSNVNQPAGDRHRRDWWNANRTPPDGQFNAAQNYARSTTGDDASSGGNTNTNQSMLPPIAPQPPLATGEAALDYTFPRRGMSLSEKRLRLALVFSQILLAVVIVSALAILTRRSETTPAVIVVTATPAPVTHMVVVLPTMPAVRVTSTPEPSPTPFDTPAVQARPTPIADVTSTPVNSPDAYSASVASSAGTASDARDANGANDASKTSSGPASTAVSMTTNVTATVAVLPCRKFTFLPDSADLTQDSRALINKCVLPVLQARAGLFLQVRGSAAWPGPKGAYTEDQIRSLAKSRAQAIVDYLISQKIDPARFQVEGVVPPVDHRETEDPVKQAEDRWVEMTLISGGR